MVDMGWLSQEANTIHAYFTSLFYVLATVLLVVGVLVHLFNLPISFVPGIGQLASRVLIAAIMLHSFPEISQMVADLADAVASRLGDLNQFKFVLDKMADKLQEFSWSWVSVKGSIVLLLSFITFFLLYFSVHVTQAFLLYTWTVLYVFSPILIALFVLPQTAQATTALYRSLFEASTWKIVWAVLATLLWSTGTSGVHEQNIIAATCYNLILAGSLVLTPLFVHMLASGGIASMAQTVGSIAVGGLTTVTPAKVAALSGSIVKHGYNQSLSAASYAASSYPKAQKVINEIPKFRVPKRKPIFEKKEEPKKAFKAKKKTKETT